MNLKQKVLAIVFLFTIATACNTSTKVEKGLVLKGNITGVPNGSKVALSKLGAPHENADTTIIENGQFTLLGNYPEPTLCYFRVEGTTAMTQMYVQNGDMSIEGDGKSYGSLKVTGCKDQEYFDLYRQKQAEINKKYQSAYMAYAKASKEEKLELEKKFHQKVKDLADLEQKFCADYPNAAHIVEIIKVKTKGHSANQIIEIIEKLGPEVQKNPAIIKYLAEISKISDIEVGIDEMLAGVSDVPYKVDKSFNGLKLTNIAYLGIFSNNNIGALKKDGTVQIIDSKGKELSSFKPEVNGEPISLAIDKNDDIYLLSCISKETTLKIRGKSVKSKAPVMVECTVFTSVGKKKNHFKCKGVVTATGAKVVGDNLIISDFRNSKLAIFTKDNGTLKKEMRGMRPCCGILDFSVNKKNEILVANLGAFRVKAYDVNGKNILAFGKRGKDINDFHGCCNPVSVTSLSSGAIVTVEKDPTRIKVYSKDGAKQIQGIQELVQGCSYIPMTVDSHDNLYLASPKKGLVKCIAM
jgi:hypothetical protein